VQLASSQHGLEQVGGVHRALGRAGTDHRVQLVDEQDDLALGVLDLLEHRLEPLLELASVLGTCHEGAKVQPHDLAVLEALRDVAAHDALGEALGDGGLAHARLADQHRVVLGPPAEDLDDAPDLLVAADDRIELARAGIGRQVTPVPGQRLVRGFRVLGGHPLAPAHLLERRQQVLPVGAGRGQDAARVTARLGGREQQVLRGHEVVVEPTCLLLGALDDLARSRVEGQLATRDAGTPREHRGELKLDGRWIGAQRAQGHGRDPLGILEQGGEQVLSVEHGALGVCRQALGGQDGLLRLLGVSVELHADPPGSDVVGPIAMVTWRHPRWRPAGDRRGWPRLVGRCGRGTRWRARGPARRGVPGG